MSWVAAAVVGGAVIGAVGSNMAASKQSKAQQQAAATQQGMFNTINSQEQPFIQNGYGASKTLAELMGTSGAMGTNADGTSLPDGYLTSTFNPTQDQLNQYPGYQFALQTGGQAIRNADTPGVGALSGAALKDLTAFNVGTANQYYGQYFNQDQTQKNNIFSRLSAIAGLGQNAASQVGNNGAQLGTGIAQAQAAGGSSQAAGIVGGTNALSSGATSLAGMMYLNGGNSTNLSNGLTLNNSTGGYTTTVPGSMGPQPAAGG